jgi:membrane protease YdiL (CAAX protease family)
MERKLLKRDFNKLGIPLLIQQLLLFLTAGIGVFIWTTLKCIQNPNINEDTIKELSSSLTSNGDFLGIIMIIAVLIGFIPIIIFRGNKFFHYDLKVKNKSFNFKIIIFAFAVVLSVNFLSGILSNLLELLLNQIGLTAAPSQEALNTPTTIWMIIYSCIMAPFFEEFLYRGAILRYLEKYGARFAIITSAILFGFMHGNIIQIPFAIVIGLIFGFLAKEYSIKLSIIIHMANNIYAQAFNSISSSINEITINIVYVVIALICITLTIILIATKGNVIKDWFQNNKIEKKMLLYFFTSITLVLILIYNIITTFFGIVTL